MAGIGDYSKKKKGERGFEMKNMAYWKGKNGHFLEKEQVGPVATPKPFDREKFEEETRIAQGMENVLNHGFSRDQDEEFINYEDPSDPDKS